MKDLIPAAFQSDLVFPIEYEVPYSKQYEYMKHSIMKEYGLTKQQAGEMTEYDYTAMVCFKNLEGKKEEYLIKKEQ